MAGDWMKIELGLPDKPEVWRMAGILNIDADAVTGKLLRVWAWFDTHTTDGNALGVSYPLLDRVAGVIGFAEAMALCGWLEQSGHVLSIPKFDRHNGKTAKNRALTAERVAKHRVESNADSNAQSVTKTVTREEKRRVIPPKAPKGALHDFPPGFDRFWAVYPKKEAKVRAAQAFARLKADDLLIGLMLVAIARQAKSEAWTKDGGQFIPLPATWLNGRRWEDEGTSIAADDPFAGAA